MVHGHPSAYSCVNGFGTAGPPPDTTPGEHSSTRPLATRSHRAGLPAQGAPCGRVPRACTCTSPAVHGRQLPAARGRKQRQHHVDQATSASQRRPSRQRRKRSLSRERASTLANLSAAPTAEAHPVPNKPRGHSQHIHKVLRVGKAPRRAQKMHAMYSTPKQAAASSMRAKKRNCHAATSASIRAAVRTAATT